VFAWISARRQQDFVAGMILGIATALKLFFGIFFVLFIFFRRWRLGFYFICTFIFCNLISLVILKTQTFLNFFSSLQNMPWYAGSWNGSFLGFFSRILGGSMNIPLVELPWLAHALSLLLSVMLLFGMIWLMGPSSCSSGNDRFDLIFSLALVEMLLISPYGWLYYFPILVLPMIVAWRFATRHNFSILFNLLLIFAWILINIPTPLIWAEDVKMNQPIVWFTSAGIYFYALLVLTGVFIGLLCKRNKLIFPGKAI
jgi:hypothetical protein